MLQLIYLRFDALVKFVVSLVVESPTFLSNIERIWSAATLSPVSSRHFTSVSHDTGPIPLPANH